MIAGLSDNLSTTKVSYKDSTVTVPTLYSQRALPRASMVWMSRWLVGSSMMRKLGPWPHSTANATRDFWPPDRESIFCRA